MDADAKLGTTAGEQKELETKKERRFAVWPAGQKGQVQK